MLKNPILMAKAFKNAVISGRDTILAGRMEKKYFANPSSPKKDLFNYFFSSYPKSS